ncbi:hypothetical protein BB559_000578 [Furculomyces boomerangus]|uniref:thioredoxin-dependent peroxiredoxin n=2 Tax=Harpellales TaxID=61421 RepID=A0A2T9Z4S1_9FUNG|nr:hypothetical protein BB559_000578 [Furculomyces boomerangus]PWA00959.1 hypothetical protein BB558_002996 [Smittium angustum]
MFTKFQLVKSFAKAANFSTSSIARQLVGAKAQVQKPAPHFAGTAVLDKQFKQISLDDFKGKYLALVFYPLDFTFVCPTELLAFSDRKADFDKLNTQVIGISTDSHFSHLAWTNLPRNKGGLGDISIPLLSDLNHTISKDYGVLIQEAGIALRGLFLIDDKGNLRVSQINDLPIGRSVDETLRLIEAIQFTNEHGEVCPANWKKGSATIKPSPKDSLEYFEKEN